MLGQPGLQRETLCQNKTNEKPATVGLRLHIFASALCFSDPFCGHPAPFHTVCVCICQHYWSKLD